jgi:diguanylate cyclase (GGDEF)-like protein
MWIIIIFAALVLALGAASLISPKSFWHSNEIEIMLPPQILFLTMIMLVIISLYFTRRETENRRLRLANLEQTLAHHSERSAGLLDSLTNVFNRNFLYELLQSEIARAERNQRPLALIMCDVNHFKRINDRYGHLMGDYVLAQVAAILKYCIRGSDYIVRYGGDEFLIILPETEERGANVVLRRMQQKVAEWDQENRVGDVPISVSLGLYHHVPGQAAEKDLAEADSRMYQAKQAVHAKEAVAAQKLL